MRINIVVAMDENQGIGFEGQMPWRLPADLARVKKLTMGHTLIMGRKTFESIGKPLPGRKIIILTQNPKYTVEGCQIAHSLSDALNLALANGAEQIFIFGGASVYREGLAVADRLYITRVHGEFQVDTSFPEWDSSKWIEITNEYHPADPRHKYPLSFKIFKRKQVVP